MWKRATVSAVVLALTVLGCGEPREIQSGAMGVNAQVGDVLMQSVHVEAPPQGSYPPGAEARVWLTLLNQGAAPDSLVEVASPVAERVEIRWDRECDGAFDTVPDLPLRPPEPTGTGLPGTEVPTGVVPFDAYHLRMVDLRSPVLAGTSVELTFRFERAGEITIRAQVQPPDVPRPEPSTRCD
jgi:copper(I)-binding protein